ncbi:MAG: PadR family transcriptional regulator [Chloroflexi bacterium]|nr:PadR family transcriptional regulator [Chloroflexota bacterium]
MPLSHAILGFLEYQPMTGYDLKKIFDQSVAHFWSATQSHIYKALETLEKDGFVESQIIQGEGKPNRKQYQITQAGRGELHRWVSTPLPLETQRHAWLIQVFFAHGHTNEDVISLFEQRIAAIEQYQAQALFMAQTYLDENAKQVGIQRLGALWQLTLDYGNEYYANEVAWLKKTIGRIRELPPMTLPE